MERQRRSSWIAAVPRALCACSLLACGPLLGGWGDDGVVSAGGGPPNLCPDAEVIATVASVGGLAASNGQVYWMDGDSVFEAEPGETGSPTLLMTLGAGETAWLTGNRLTLDETYVYASGDDGVFRLRRRAVGVPQKVSEALTRIHALAVTSTDLFIGRQYGAAEAPDAGSLFSVPLRGGERVRLHVEACTWDLESDGDEVFWSDAGSYTGQTYNNDGRVGRLGPAGEQVFLDGLTGTPMGIGLDDTFLYVADFHAGLVLRLPRNGGEPEVIAEVETVRDVAPAPEGLYVTSDRAEELQFVPSGSTEPVCVARLPPGTRGHPKEVALDATFAYYSTIVPGEYDGAVVRAPRRMP